MVGRYDIPVAATTILESLIIGYNVKGFMDLINATVLNGVDIEGKCWLQLDQRLQDKILSLLRMYFAN